MSPSRHFCPEDCPVSFRLLFEVLILLALAADGSLETGHIPFGADYVYRSLDFHLGPADLSLGFYDLPGRKFRMASVGGDLWVDRSNISSPPPPPRPPRAVFLKIIKIGDVKMVERRWVYPRPPPP
jgi:hypothetical protein